MTKTPIRNHLPAVATFSIVAVDVATGEIGVGVQSKFLAVGSVVPWVRAGVGAIATQSWANTSYGPRGLELLEQGLHPSEVIAQLTGLDEDKDARQIGIVNARGDSATYTGSGCFAYAGGIAGQGFAAQGNILASAAVVDGLVEGIQSEGALADRLIRALSLAQAAGGDKRGMQSAALYIAKQGAGYGGFNDRFIDLRVDEHASPIQELDRLLHLQRLYFGRTRQEDVLPLSGDTLAEIRDLLRQKGYEAGSGPTYDETTKSQLQQYFLTENFDDRWTDEATIDGLVLDYMRKH
ncbi:DUF1028 domain-containing protein [Alicyclobacillus fastidiosus]|uniref:DUF1028 domain-containing protein n=1 Tax=Alicyclobacillus fastidiosus TaxID=392011 RepID=A0ABY6ZF67_9BACL|nr:DUF1028 domain-containing protein [Alicyclobacillus fastidiosus]WAH40775.1 DUF1028 domain-containing protein [Alicyclobacillus fastidiosus]GMA62250.1 hypothetical protein GCM10025859_26900 [Alicyclobacillus fastidiosus]